MTIARVLLELQDSCVDSTNVKVSVLLERKVVAKKVLRVASGWRNEQLRCSYPVVARVCLPFGFCPGCPSVGATIGGQACRAGTDRFSAQIVANQRRRIQETHHSDQCGYSTNQC